MSEAYSNTATYQSVIEAFDLTVTPQSMFEAFDLTVTPQSMFEAFSLTVGVEVHCARLPAAYEYNDVNIIYDHSISRDTTQVRGYHEHLCRSRVVIYMTARRFCCRTHSEIFVAMTSNRRRVEV